MNLVIDQGNTFTKFGVFDKSKLIYSDSNKILDKTTIHQYLSGYNIDKIIISSVQKEYISDKSFYSFFQIRKDIEIHILTSNSTLPIKNHYKSKTLGKDRIAALVGAYQLYPGYPKLIIDAGTAITIDFLNENNSFLGGNISPGIQTRFNSLKQNTKKLPLLSLNPESPFLGQSTDEAIWSGVQNGTIFEIEGYINHFNKLNIKTKTILTGGDAYFFAKNLKNPIFVDLNLVITGLNTILEYNAKNK